MMMREESFAARLRAKAAEEGLELDRSQALALGRHYEEMVRYNRVHNLTRIVGAEDAIERHYLDSLRGLAQLGTPRADARVVDVGSGAGFPGVVAASVWPKARVTLVEPTRKRATFLRVMAQGSEPRFSVEQVRLDQVAGFWDVVLTRATFSWERNQGAFSKLLALLAKGGTLGCWMGGFPDERGWKAFCAERGAEGERVEVVKGALCIARR